MTTPAHDCSIRILHWTVGLVVLLESCLLAFEPERIHAFARTGLPHWIRTALAWPEVGAAILFLVPATSTRGGWVLLMIFALAALLHILHGRADVGALLVYAAAVLVVINHTRNASRDISADG